MKAPDQSKQQGMEIAALFSCVLLAIGLFPLLGEGETADIRILPLQIAFFLLLIGVLVPKLLKPVYIVWMKFAELLHKIVSPLTLGIMFVLIFIPVSLGLRVRKKDLLLTRPENKNKKTFWRTKNKNIPFDMTKQF